MTATNPSYVPIPLVQWPGPKMTPDFSGAAPEPPRIYVGSSDAGAILGYSKWSTPGDQWARIIHLVERYDPEEASKHTRHGRMFERAIGEEWARIYKPVRFEPGPRIDEAPLVAPDGWRTSRPDFKATMPDGSCVYVECKAVWQWDTDPMHGWGSPGTDFVPRMYRCQGAWQMGVGHAVGDNPVRVDVVAYNAGDRDLRIYHLPYGPVVPWLHQKIETWMREHVWCDPPRPPMIPSIETLQRIYPGPPPGVEEKKRSWIEPTAETLALGRRMARIADAKKVLASKEDEVQRALCAFIGDHYGIRGVASWHGVKGRESIDQQRLKLEQPLLYERYVQRSKPHRSFMNRFKE